MSIVQINDSKAQGSKRSKRSRGKAAPAVTVETGSAPAVTVETEAAPAETQTDKATEKAAMIAGKHLWNAIKASNAVRSIFEEAGIIARGCGADGARIVAAWIYRNSDGFTAAAIKAVEDDADKEARRLARLAFADSKRLATEVARASVAGLSPDQAVAFAADKASADKAHAAARMMRKAAFRPDASVTDAEIAKDAIKDAHRQLKRNDTAGARAFMAKAAAFVAKVDDEIDRFDLDHAMRALASAFEHKLAQMKAARDAS